MVVFAGFPFDAFVWTVTDFAFCGSSFSTTGSRLSAASDSSGPATSLFVRESKR